MEIRMPAGFTPPADGEWPVRVEEVSRVRGRWSEQLEFVVTAVDSGERFRVWVSLTSRRQLLSLVAAGVAERDGSDVLRLRPLPLHALVRVEGGRARFIPSQSQHKEEVR